MERRVQERLVGAVVLVLLGVWLIPWVLDGPDAPQSQDSAPPLQLPVPDRSAVPESDGRRAQTVELDVKRSEAAGPLPARSGSSADAPTSASSASSSPARAANDAGTEPHGTSEATRSNPGTERPAATVAASGSTPVRTPSAATEAASDGWMVQLGSFSDEDNALRLAKRVEGFGYTARISNHTTSGRVMYRVRVGPIESRQRAEATASALSVHGFVAQLVAPG
jgi:DedD protein